MSAFSPSVEALLKDYYRCPNLPVTFSLSENLSSETGYFRVKDGPTAYGRIAEMTAPESFASVRAGAEPHPNEAGQIGLPFDPSAVVANLRLEKYTQSNREHKGSGQLVRRLYYLLRPLLSVQVRKHLQRRSLKGWDQIPFPHWPVDRTVDQLHEWLLVLAMNEAGEKEIPFVWFWPDGHSSCASVTHDIETAAGRDFCEQLMDLNDSFGIKTSFQVVPEERYEVPPTFLEGLRRRGFEINVHDLNHDGRLFFVAHDEFRERVRKINQYGREFQANGFRSAVLYRNHDWLQELEFDYDMSIPNVGHLDPQRGGCCTVMPYVINQLLEIPVTTTQDYSLFNILQQQSTELWRRQLAIITRANGMATFIVHPDYIREAPARDTYKELLGVLSESKVNEDLWIAQPGQINEWWRKRASLELVKSPDGWRIEGEESARARIAYAYIEDGSLTYRVDHNVERRSAVGHCN